jgi:hypothetical protein
MLNPKRPPTAAATLLPFYAVVQDGMKRLFEFVENEGFTFVVNGEKYESTLCEAILLSRAVSDALHIDCTIREFVISGSTIDSKDLETVLAIVRSSEGVCFSSDHKISFLSICQQIENDALSISLLNHFCFLVNDSNDSDFDSDSHFSISDRIGHCAAHFALYSIEELRCIDKRILHLLLSSDDLRIENEDELLTVLINLGEDYFEFWCYIKIRFLSDSSLGTFVSTLPFDAMNEDIWSQLVSLLNSSEIKGDCFSRYDTRFRSVGVLIESHIISKIPGVLEELRDDKWDLLYRGSRDGFSSKAFHDKCDGIGNTVTFILTSSGGIFGGFTAIPWESGTGVYRTDVTGKSFLFVVKNLLSLRETKFRLSYAPFAIYCNSTHGPTFGNHSLHVANACNTNNSSYIALGLSYSGDSSISGARFFPHAVNFTVKEIEVFSVRTVEKKS